MASNEMVLTSEGRAQLEEELEHRREVLRRDISEQLRTAREFGDLSENAEHDAAREAQAQNESRIAEIEHTLRTAKVAEEVIMSERGLVANVGTQVLLEDERGKRQSFTLVGSSEIMSLQFKISNESPLGAALIGHTAGDPISFVTPSGKVRQYTLIEVTSTAARGADE